MSLSISLHNAVTQLIMSNVNNSFMSVYEVSLIVFELIKNGKFKDKELRIKTTPNKKHVTGVLNHLESAGILIKIPGLSSNVLAFQPLFMKEKDKKNKLICEVDPFLYISHLSAMSYHGLTDRLPTTIYCTALNDFEWSYQGQLKMKKDLGDDYSNYIQETNLPIIRRARFDKGKFLGSAVKVLKISDIGGAYNNIENGMRVSAIGRTFRDMLKRPLFCGGMQHVISVYEEYGETYSKQIIDEIDQHGTKIEKSRAGYLLENECGIKDSRINLWLDTVQRGGSRKLDPNAEYDSDYSERWGISINA